MKLNRVTDFADAELLPEHVEIDGMRLISHLAIQADKTPGASGAVTGFERFAEPPILPDVAPCLEDAAQRILQAFFVFGLLANFYVRQKTEERSTPVSACPSVG